MRSPIATLLVALGVFTAGCAAPQSNSKTTNANTRTTSAPQSPAAQSSANTNNMDHGGINHGLMGHSQMQSSPGAASAPYDLQFIDTMMAHHQGAIDMARLVLVPGRDPLVRGLAEDIIAAQQAEIHSMTARLRVLESGQPSDADGFPPLSGTRGK